MDSSTSTSELRTVSQTLQGLMERLESGIGRLQALLRETPPVAARVFRLPRIRAGEEHEPYAFISSEPLEGAAAWEASIHAFAEFYGGSGVSTKSVFRLPGVVALQGRPELKQQVETVNRAKEEFAQVIRSIEDRNLRFDIVHRLFPMLITLQSTRQIQSYDQSMRSVTFTWGRKSSIRVVARDELLDTLKNLRKQKPLAFEEDRWLEAISDDMSRLLTLPSDAELRYRRDLKVRPMANLLQSDGTKLLREAHLPILILNPGEDFRIGQLPDFDANEKPKRGRKNPQRLTEDERFLTCLPVYRAKQ